MKIKVKAAYSVERQIEKELNLDDDFLSFVEDYKEFDKIKDSQDLEICIDQYISEQPVDFFINPEDENDYIYDIETYILNLDELFGYYSYLIDKDEE